MKRKISIIVYVYNLKPYNYIEYRNNYLLSKFNASTKINKHNLNLTINNNNENNYAYVHYFGFLELKLNRHLNLMTYYNHLDLLDTISRTLFLLKLLITIRTFMVLEFYIV